MYDPFRNYDAWKTAYPPEYDDPDYYTDEDYDPYEEDYPVVYDDEDLIRDEVEWDIKE